jgi:hydroxymethylpyrimidine pyrophosphatase-like HAD family hydrolase
MTYDIPGQEKIEIKTIILDLNGTLSVAGTVTGGVKERLNQLKNKGYKVLFFTGNTRNDADDLATSLGHRVEAC